MEKELLLKKVQENIYKVPNRQSENISVENGTLIVLGYQENWGDDEISFTLMGKYNDGVMRDVYLKDSLVLESTQPVKLSEDTPLNTLKNDHMETAEWWRLPTADEMELYNMVYSE